MSSHVFNALIAHAVDMLAVFFVCSLERGIQLRLPGLLILLSHILALLQRLFERDRRHRIGAMALAFGVLVAGLLAPFSPQGGAVPGPIGNVAAAAANQDPDSSGVLTVSFLDVGQGDSILFQGPDFTMLVDAGRHDRNDVVPHLQNLGVTNIDLLVGTHPHADHIGQMDKVLQAFPVTEVWLNGSTHTSRTFERVIDAIAASGAGYHEPRAGESQVIGSLQISILHPGYLSGSANDDSIVHDDRGC